MDGPLSFWEAVDDIRSSDDRFAPEAYGFVMDALEHTLRSIGIPRHVSARELLEGMCAFARERYGVMSYTLLERWNVTSTEDIGDVVFQLVDAGVLSRQDSDSRLEFSGVFALREVLETGYFDRSAGGADAV
jgi:uncharacterized repeat protein (TIGR04138 family)